MDWNNLKKTTLIPLVKHPRALVSPLFPCVCFVLSDFGEIQITWVSPAVEDDSLFKFLPFGDDYEGVVFEEVASDAWACVVEAECFVSPFVEILVQISAPVVA